MSDLNEQAVVDMTVASEAVVEEAPAPAPKRTRRVKPEEVAPTVLLEPAKAEPVDERGTLTEVSPGISLFIKG